MNQESNNNSAKSKMKAVVCGHCGKELMVKMPSKPGRYKFTCPQCASKVSFEVKLPDGGPVLKVLKSGVLDDRVISRQAPKVPKKTPALPEDESLEAATTQRRSPAIANIPVLGMPKKSAGKDKQYYMVEKAQVNKRYRIVCPECGKDLLIMSRSADKYNMIKCSICGTQVFYKSASKVSVPQERLDKAQQAPEDARKTPPPPPPVQVAKKPVPPVPPVPPPSKPEPQSVDDKRQHTVFLHNGGIGGNGRNNAAPGASVGAPPPPPQSANVPNKVPVITWRDPKAMLCWKTGTLVRRTKNYRLIRGRNTVGRYDPELPSDVMIDGDDEMSRQSVEIMAVIKPDFPDYIYELRVLHATNPVLVNNRPVEFGKTVQLNYGDTICLGRTNISFVKVNEDKR